MEKKRRKSANYSREFKLKAVQMYLSGEHGGYDQITKDLGLPTNRNIRRWVERYQEFGLEGLEERRGKSTFPRKGRPTIKSMTVEEENKKLRAEVEFLKKLWEHKRRG